MILTDEALDRIDTSLRDHPGMHLNPRDAASLVADLREARGLMHRFLDADGIDQTYSRDFDPLDDGWLDQFESLSRMLMMLAVRYGLALGRITMTDLTPELQEALAAP